MMKLTHEQLEAERAEATEIWQRELADMKAYMWSGGFPSILLRLCGFRDETTVQALCRQLAERKLAVAQARETALAEATEIIEDAARGESIWTASNKMRALREKR